MENLNELMTTKKINYSYDEELEIILNALKKNELKNITDSHGLKGCSSLTKAGLSERIIETISDAGRLEEVLNGLDDMTKNDFAMLANEAYVTTDSVKGPGIMTLINLGYTHLALNGDDIVLMMPKVVKDAYGRIESQEAAIEETNEEETPEVVAIPEEVTKEEAPNVEDFVEKVPTRNLAYVPARTISGKIVPIKVNKTGRNEPCPCGSGKKYKKCCGR